LRRTRATFWILAITLPLALVVAEGCCDTFPLTADRALTICTLASLAGLYAASLRDAARDRCRKAELVYLHVVRIPLAVFFFGAYAMALGFASLAIFGLPPQD